MTVHTTATPTGAAQIGYSVVAASHVGRRIEEDFGIRCQCLLLRGSCNDTYRVDSEGGTYAFRLYGRGWRTPEEIRAELAALRALGDAGIPVCGAIPTAQGEPWITFECPEGLRYGVLFEFIHGLSVTGARLSEHAADFGRLVGRMHRHSSSWTPEASDRRLDLAYLLFDSLERVVRVVVRDPASEAFLRNVVERCAERLAARPSLETGFCHGDLLSNNAILTDSGIALIDFDSSGYGWRAYELSYFLWASYATGDKGLLERFLGGYEEEHRMGRDDRDMLATLCVVAKIWSLGAYVAKGERLGNWYYFDADNLARELALIRAWSRKSGVL